MGLKAALATSAMVGYVAACYSMLLVRPSPSFMHLIQVDAATNQVALIALIAFTIPLAAYGHAEHRRRERVRRELPLFLRELSALLLANTPLAVALAKLSRLRGPVGKAAERAAKRLAVTGDVDSALDALARALGTKEGRRAAKLVRAVYMSGARVGEALGDAAKALEEAEFVAREREAELMPLLAVSYLALGVLLALAYAVVAVFLPAALGFAAAFPAVAAAPPEFYEAALLWLAAAISLSSPLAVAKAVRGSPLPGLKHSVAMLAITYAAFYLFI